MVWVFVIWIANFAISWWNAWSAGKAWAEAKFAGGWPWFMCWMAAIMSASGFTWCYLIALVLGVQHFSPEHMPPEVAAGALSLGYIIIIPGVLFSGFMIMVDSWAYAWRTRRLLDIGRAAYNTYAEMHNAYNMINTIGRAFQHVLKLSSDSGRSSSRGKGRGGVVVVFLVVLALLAGVITTAAIINRAAATAPLPDFDEAERQAGRRPQEFQEV